MDHLFFFISQSENVHTEIVIIPSNEDNHHQDSNSVYQTNVQSSQIGEA